MKHLLTASLLGAFTVAAFTVAASSVHAQDMKFDFGSGPVAAGYQGVTSETRYDAQTGFGFEGEAKISAQDHPGKDPKTADALRRDCVVADGPFSFSVAVPEGFYDVTVVLGDARAAATTSVKAEARRLMLLNVQTEAGQFEKRTFSVAVKRPELAGGRRQNLKASQSPLNWDDRLTLEFNGARPALCSLEIVPAKTPVAVFLAGDSTVTDQGGEPWAGWGQILPRFFKQGAVVYNNAQSGETLSSFAAGGLLQKIGDLSQPGDALLIQFGHNDQKEKGEGALANYKTNLGKYIAFARDKGLVPVLVTPMERRIWKGGQLTPTLADHAAAMREVGEAEKVPVIDLNAASVTLFTSLGEGGSKTAFVHYPANTFPNQEKALRDDSHFSAFGAYELARVIADGLRAHNLDVAKFLADDFTRFDPSKPDDAATLALPLSPIEVAGKPEGS